MYINGSQGNKYPLCPECVLNILNAIHTHVLNKCILFPNSAGPIMNGRILPNIYSTGWAYSALIETTNYNSIYLSLCKYDAIYEICIMKDDAGFYV